MKNQDIKNLVISIKYQTLTPLFMDSQLAGLKLMCSNEVSENDIVALWNLKTEFNGNNDEELVESFLKKVSK